MGNRHPTWFVGMLKLVMTATGRDQKPAIRSQCRYDIRAFHESSYTQSVYYSRRHGREEFCWDAETNRGDGKGQPYPGPSLEAPGVRHCNRFTGSIARPRTPDRSLPALRLGLSAFVAKNDSLDRFFGFAVATHPFTQAMSSWVSSMSRSSRLTRKCSFSIENSASSIVAS